MHDPQQGIDVKDETRVRDIANGSRLLPKFTRPEGGSFKCDCI